MSKDIKSEKKQYSFGSYEIMDFDTLVSSYAPDLNNLAIYARIPIPAGDCNDGGPAMTPADLCMAIN